jgi:hypothetical protein
MPSTSRLESAKGERGEVFRSNRVRVESRLLSLSLASFPSLDAPPTTRTSSGTTTDERGGSL